ncbi:UDP-2,3-diacylglucosamine diphosphatase [Cellvibrio sp. ARAG 10.3]|uniref:UDP-2,3-diacylglucosamine diphosphatase n=1 Tax=Cellvibrio sp. ARAG 10.3 TaxID=3451358 RepID=UPI003F446375
MTTLFISDLHLHESRPAVTEAFYQFLRERAGNAEALYILGDFFDAWIGDDDDSPLNAATAHELRQLSDQGTAIFLMHGNRDFLLGEAFATAAGARLLVDPTLIDLYGQPTLLMHGDILCTRDTEYQAFRQQVRSAAWQQQILSQPLAARRALAAQIRAQSKSMNSIKAEDIMDVTPDEVVRVMQAHGVRQLIHGHTHRPARHPLMIDGAPAERIVLGDWHDAAWCIFADPGGLELRHWSIRK